MMTFKRQQQETTGGLTLDNSTADFSSKTMHPGR